MTRPITAAELRVREEWTDLGVRLHNAHQALTKMADDAYTDQGADRLRAKAFEVLEVADQHEALTASHDIAQQGSPVPAFRQWVNERQEAKRTTYGGYSLALDYIRATL